MAIGRAAPDSTGVETIESDDARLDVAGAAFAAGWRGSLSLLCGPFRALVLGQATGQFADGLAQISFAQLILFDIGTGATPARIASVLAVTLLPFSVVGPLAGVFIDRWDRRRTLITASWLRAALAVVGVGAALGHSEVAAYFGVLLMLSSSRFVLDAKGAILPRTVRSEDLVRANAISGLMGMSAAFIGAVGGSMFVSLSVSAGFVSAALSYLAAGVLFRRLPFAGGGDRVGRRIGTALGGLAGQLGAGMRATAVTPDLRRPLLAVSAHRLLLGGGFVLLVLVADNRYHVSAPGYGLAVAVTGISAFAGTVCAPWLVARWRPDALLPLAFLPPAAAVVVAGYSPTLIGLLAALAATAVSFQCLKVLADALVGRATTDAIRGRVFAFYDVLYNVAFALAGIAMVPLWHLDRVRALLWWMGAAFGLGWLAFAWLYRGWPFVGDARGPDRPRLPRLSVAATLACGALPVLAFPKPALWWLAWFALVPWLILIRRAPSARGAGGIGWFGGLGFLVAMHYWLLPSTTVLLPIAACLVAVLWVPWAVLTWWLLSPPLEGRRLAAALVVIPAGWAIIEGIRSWSALGGPWGLLGASQWNSPAFLAPASLGGVWLVTFLIVAVNVAVLGVVLARTWTLRACAGCVTVAVLLTGPVCYAVEPEPRGTGSDAIALVEAGVVHDPTTRLRTEIAATAKLPTGKFQLVVWGESSVGFDLFARADLRRQLQSLAARLRADLLVNVDAVSPSGGIGKTAVLIGRSGILATDSKMRLVPFGEYIPLRPLLGWLSSVTKAAARNRIRGRHLEVMHADGLVFAPLICFESAFPDMSRTVARGGAELLVFQTATTTFQGSWAPDQHAALAAVRAVETGRPTVQATLSGTAAAFDSEGHRLAWSPAATGTITLAVPRATVATPYDTLGDWVPAWSFAVVVLEVIAISLDPVLDHRPSAARRP